MGGVWKNIAGVYKVLGDLDIQPSQIIRWNGDNSCWESNYASPEGFFVSLLRMRIDRALHQVKMRTSKTSKE
ncbi:hypothetical protein L2E82_08474 [Cichorium intybus]|uniref:Uncharacterized protein n=1 Tax=Cichorium intybus TaxID=13427 RepID=A0ACB9G7J6_CICIN|nr:hypothetical protein L2E82_08474 [Cichorium intybus]